MVMIRMSINLNLNFETVNNFKRIEIVKWTKCLRHVNRGGDFNVSKLKDKKAKFCQLKNHSKT